MTLGDKIKEAVERDGLCELIVRVSRFEDTHPGRKAVACWQAVAKYQGREAGPWGVGIRKTAEAAMLAALEEGARLSEPVEVEDSDGDIFK